MYNYLDTERKLEDRQIVLGAEGLNDSAPESILKKGEFDPVKYISYSRRKKYCTRGHQTSIFENDSSEA